MMPTRYFTKLAEVGGNIPDLFTPDWLEATARRAESLMANGRPDLSELCWVKEQCERAATWMRQSGPTALRFVGGLRPNPFSRGQLVEIPKGTRISSSAGGFRTAKRALRVRIHDAYAGYADIDHGKVWVRNPAIIWAGSGGYWMQTEIEHIPVQPA